MAPDPKKAGRSKPPISTGDSPAPAKPFDRWLDSQLHAIYDRVAQEPLPDDLLRLIEADERSASSAPPAGKDTLA